MMARLAYCDANQTGVLTIQTGDGAVYSYNSGITGLTYRIELSPRGWRLTADYSFILGKPVTE